MKTLLITGVAGPMGRQIARLAADSGIRVLGVDVTPLPRPRPDITFIQSDVRNPLLQNFIKAEHVDTILHGAFRWRKRRGEAIFENNVLGTVKLLEAAAGAQVEHVIFPSSIFIYGPGVLDASEETPFQVRSRYAFVRNLRSIELLLDGFRKQMPHITLTVLRFAHLLGGGYPSPLARYLALPVAPTLSRHNPLMQVLHFDDAMLTLMQALRQRPDGIFNIAAPEPQALYAMLNVCRTPRITVPSLAVKGLRWTPGLGPKTKTMLPLPWEYLRESLTMTTRKAKEDLGFEPVHNGEDTVRSFAEALSQQRQNAAFPHHSAYRGVTHVLESAEKLADKGFGHLLKK